MKKSYFILSFLIIVCSINAQIISFSDNVFKSKLLESSPSNFIARDLNGDFFSIDTNSNGEIEIAEALQVGYLQIDNASISSINEINNFINLIELHCENNLLTTLNVSALSNLTILNCSANLLTDLNLVGLIEIQNLNCQFNRLSELNVSNITNLVNLNCSYNQINNLILSNLVNLEELLCNDNAITSINLSDLIGLTNLNCSNNLINLININELINLEQLNCASNLLNSLFIENLISITSINCSDNNISTLSLFNLSGLIDLNCNNNQLSWMNLNSINSLKNFSCSYNLLNSIDLSGFSQLENLNCSHNLISSIALFNLNQLVSLDCNNNQISILDINNLSQLKYLYCNFNSITILNASALQQLLVLSCTNNQITSLNLNNSNNLQSLYCNNNQITTLDLNHLISFQNLICANNNLISLFIKNGSFEGNLSFSNNPNLNFICADEFQIDLIQDEINNNNYVNCHVNSYCTFVPGGISYSLEGATKFDITNNGCDALDPYYPNLEISIVDDFSAEYFIADSSGNYTKSVKEGSYLITPNLENSNFFSISPSSISIEFPFQTSPLQQNFCVIPNGTYHDLEIAIIPLNHAIPGQESSYKLIYKNKGTTTQSGIVSLSFNDSIVDLVQANPSVSSQASNQLNWNFINLNPFEIRTIFITFLVNQTVSIGQMLPFVGTVSSSNIDAIPNDNTIHFNQTTSNITTTNDKLCIEGSSIPVSQIGDYIHYCIRFKNNGTSFVQNVIIKDVIDISKYDITTLSPISGSHPFYTRITQQNKVEFIFENINLAFNNTNNEGYVLFKIKTLPTLSNGDTFSNAAAIYFDYNTPILTNTASTIIQELSNTNFDNAKKFTIYPNPVADEFHIHSSELEAIDAIAIFNSLGQLIKTITNPNSSIIHVSDLTTGIYFINIKSGTRNSSLKFSKK